LDALPAPNEGELFRVTLNFEADPTSTLAEFKSALAVYLEGCQPHALEILSEEWPIVDVRCPAALALRLEDLPGVARVDEVRQ
jgi:hypothetical protein